MLTDVFVLGGILNVAIIIIIRRRRRRRRS